MSFQPCDDLLQARFEFQNELIEDNFTDASWLYEKRLGFFPDPNYQWTDFKPYETRLSNYLDALVNRNDSVETFCLEHAFDGESGDVFVAVYVLGKRKGLVGIRSLINDLDFSNIAFRQAFVDTVNLALDKDDQLSLVKQFFADNTPAMLEMAAKIAGPNRLDVIDSLLAILNQAITTDNPAEHELLIQATVIALGKIIALASVARDVDFLYSLFDLPLSDDTLSELCITLLKAQHPKILSHCVSQFHFHDRHPSYSDSVAEELREIAKRLEDNAKKCPQKCDDSESDPMPAPKFLLMFLTGFHCF